MHADGTERASPCVYTRSVWFTLQSVVSRQLRGEGGTGAIWAGDKMDVWAVHCEDSTFGPRDKPEQRGTPRDPKNRGKVG